MSDLLLPGLIIGAFIGYIAVMWMRGRKLRRQALATVDRIALELGGEPTPEIPSDMLRGLRTFHVGYVGGTREDLVHVSRWSNGQQRFLCIHHPGISTADVDVQHVIFGFEASSVAGCFRLSGSRITYARGSRWLPLDPNDDAGGVFFDAQGEVTVESAVDVLNAYTRAFATRTLEDDIVVCDGWIVVVGPFFSRILPNGGTGAELKEYVMKALAFASMLA